MAEGAFAGSSALNTRSQDMQGKEAVREVAKTLGVAKSTCTRVMVREKYGEGERQLTIQSISHYLSNMGGQCYSMGMYVWLPAELGHWYLLML